MSEDDGRWRSATGRQLAQAVFSRLAADQDLSDLGLPRLGERIDLRGLVVPDSPSTKLTGVPVRNLDLSGCRLPYLRLIDCDVENCRFDDGDLDDLRVWNTRISACDFSGANLGGLTFGGTEVASERTLVRSVDFRRAGLAGASFNDVDLARVD